MSKTQKGFTLVELVIVLVVLGLLIGGVLKGHDLLTNARLKRIQSDNAGIAAALATYQDRYLALPGDDGRASQRFSIYSDGINDPLAADIDGDDSGTIDGNWIGLANSETANIWKHLRASGVIAGDGDDDTQPTNAYGGQIGLRDGALLLAGHVVVLGSIDGQVARLLESRLDDGTPDSGRIRSDYTAALIDSGVPSSAGGNYDDSAKYFMAISL